MNGGGRMAGIRAEQFPHLGNYTLTSDLWKNRSDAHENLPPEMYF